MAVAESVPVLTAREIRDYHLINLQLAHLLDHGPRRVRLTGVEGQRLLVAGLRGSWNAVIEIEGLAGPELAADLDAPNLTVVVYGGVGDGSARSLCRVGGCAGRCRRGVRVPDGRRCGRGRRDRGAGAGLEISGGVLILANGADRLAGERQSGGASMPWDGWDPTPAMRAARVTCCDRRGRRARRMSRRSDRSWIPSGRGCRRRSVRRPGRAPRAGVRHACELVAGWHAHVFVGMSGGADATGRHAHEDVGMPPGP